MSKMSKIFKILFIFLAVVGVVVWVVAVYKINKAFPNAQKEVYALNEPCEYHGAEFSSQQCEILNGKDFILKYKDTKYVDYDDDEIKIVVCRLKVKNVSDKTVKITPYVGRFYHEESGWNNAGTIISDKDTKMILNPGEFSMIKLTTAVHKSSMDEKNFETLDPGDLSFIIQTYPELLILDFDE